MKEYYEYEQSGPVYAAPPGPYGPKMMQPMYAPPPQQQQPIQIQQQQQQQQQQQYQHQYQQQYQQQQQQQPIHHQQQPRIGQPPITNMYLAYNDFRGNLMDLNTRLFYSYLHSHIEMKRLKGRLSIRKQYILAHFLFEKWQWVKQAKTQEQLIHYLHLNGININSNMCQAAIGQQKQQHHERIVKLIQAFAPQRSLLHQLNPKEQLQIIDFIQFHEAKIPQDEKAVIMLVEEELKLNKQVEQVVIAIFKNVPQLVTIAEFEINIANAKRTTGSKSKTEDAGNVVPFVLDYLEFGVPHILMAGVNES